MRQMGLDYDVPKSTVCDAIKWVEVTLSKWDKIIKFDFNSWPMPLSGKIVMYICPKCKCKIEVPIEAAKEWEEEDMWNGKDKSIPLYG